jgi:hypothetical protein
MGYHPPGGHDKPRPLKRIQPRRPFPLFTHQTQAH